VDITGLFVFIFIGALAGWLAGTVMKDGGLGLLGNSIIGIVGGVAGVFFFRLLVITAGGFIGSMVTAIVGAVLLLYAVGRFKNI